MMTRERELLQQALDALTNCLSEHGHRCNRCDSEIDEGGKLIAALREALAAPQAEPVAWYLPSPDGDDSIFRDHRTVVACTGNKWEGFLPLYAAPLAAPAPAAPVVRESRHVRKVGGSFQHTGTVVAEFRTTAGEPRIVLEFDAPVAGMLHVYRPDQVEPCEPVAPAATSAAPAVPLTDEKITKALRRAFSLGQTHWQQADSDSYKQNAKAAETRQKFETLIAETLNGITGCKP